MRVTPHQPACVPMYKIKSSRFGGSLFSGFVLLAPVLIQLCLFSGFIGTRINVTLCLFSGCIGTRINVTVFKFYWHPS